MLNIIYATFNTRKEVIENKKIIAKIIHMVF